MHDATLRRTTDVATVFPTRADDPVETFTLAEIRRLDAGSWHDPAHRGAGVPTLKETLALLAPTDCSLLVELKVDNENLVRDELAAHLTAHPEARLAAGSIDVHRIRRLQALMPDLPVGVLFVDATTITDDTLAEYAGFADFLGFRHDQIPASVIDRVHAAGLTMLHNTVTRAFMDEGAGHGADGNMTDYPDRKHESTHNIAIVQIEAESLVADGTEIVRNEGLHFKLSGGAALRLRGEPGDHLTLPFRTPKSGIEVECVLVRRPGGAVVDLYLDDQLRVQGYDTDGPSASRQTVRLGAVTSSTSQHEVRIVIADGSNTASGVTIDLIVLRPSPSEITTG